MKRTWWQWLNSLILGPERSPDNEDELAFQERTARMVENRQRIREAIVRRIFIETGDAQPSEETIRAEMWKEIHRDDTTPILQAAEAAGRKAARLMADQIAEVWPELRNRLPSESENPNGLHRRYVISKADGSPIDPEAVYFVLRLDAGGSDAIHVKACQDAAIAYYDTIREESIENRGRHLLKLAYELRSLANKERGRLNEREELTQTTDDTP